MNNATPIQELPSKSVALLRDVMSGLKIDPQLQPQEFILVLHANHIIRLAEEIIFLESHDHKTASPVIARAIYESLFKLAMAAEHPSLATEKALREIEWSEVQSEFPGTRPEKLKEVRERPEYDRIRQLISSLGQRWKLATNQIESDKNHSTFWCASKAGMVRVYQHQYAELSTFAHASADTFVMHAFGITSARVLVHVTYALLLAATKITTKYRHQLSDKTISAVRDFERMFRSHDSTGRLRDFQLAGLTKTGSVRPSSPEKGFEKN